MHKSELTERSIYIVTEYYKNNIRPFLDSFSKDCLWIGPAEGQMIRTRKALHAAFDAENTPLTFDMYDLEVIPMNISMDSMDIILIYTVVTYYPNGDRTIFRQRTELLWAKEFFTDDDGQKIHDFFIHVCHISNEYPYAKSDRIYLNRFNELEIARLYSPIPVSEDSKKLSFKGTRNSFFYLSPTSVLWISCKRGNTIIHTARADYESTETLADIVKRYPDVLIRIHSSHAVNPLFITDIGRFFVVLSNGTKLSVPEKKYTKIRAEINQFMEHSPKS